MSKMNALVTGGSGFIGSHLVDALLNNGHHVRVLSRQSQPGNLAGVRDRIVLETGSLLHETDFDWLVNDIDVVYHLAWTSVPASSMQNKAQDMETNVLPTLSLLDACVRKRVRKVVFISSGGTVYGVPQAIPIPESHPLNPISSYGISKVMVEKYLHLYAHLHQLEYAVLRVANAYGERQSLTKGQGVVNIWINKILRNEPIEIWGDGTVTRDYVHVGDIAQALLLAGTRSSAGNVFNVGTGIGVSLNQLLTILQQIMDEPVTSVHAGDRKFDVPVNVLDATSIRKTLGWEPQIALQEGVRRTYQYLAGKFNSPTKPSIR